MPGLDFPIFRKAASHLVRSAGRGTLAPGGAGATHTGLAPDSVSPSIIELDSHLFSHIAASLDDRDRAMFASTHTAFRRAPDMEGLRLRAIVANIHLSYGAAFEEPVLTRPQRLLRLIDRGATIGPHAEAFFTSAARQLRRLPQASTYRVFVTLDKRIATLPQRAAIQPRLTLIRSLASLPAKNRTAAFDTQLERIGSLSDTMKGEGLTELGRTIRYLSPEIALNRYCLVLEKLRGLTCQRLTTFSSLVKEIEYLWPDDRHAAFTAAAESIDHVIVPPKRASAHAELGTALRLLPDTKIREAFFLISHGVVRNVAQADRFDPVALLAEQITNLHLDHRNEAFEFVSHFVSTKLPRTMRMLPLQSLALQTKHLPEAARTPALRRIIAAMRSELPVRDYGPVLAAAIKATSHTPATERPRLLANALTLALDVTNEPDMVAILRAAAGSLAGLNPQDARPTIHEIVTRSSGLTKTARKSVIGDLFSEIAKGTIDRARITLKYICSEILPLPILHRVTLTYHVIQASKQLDTSLRPQLETAIASIAVRCGNEKTSLLRAFATAHPSRQRS